MDVDLTSDIESGELDAGTSRGTVPQQPNPAGTVPAQGKDAVHTSEAPQKELAPKKGNLRDQLSAAFKGEDGKPGEQAAATSNDGQPRGPDGKFAPKGAPAEQPGTVTGTEQQGQQPAAVQAPRGIDPTVFAALPAETQQQVASTMATVEQQAARYQGYEQLEQVIGPRRQAWAINGVSEAQAVNQLLAISDFATQSPPDFIQWYAGQHGIDLSALVQQSAASDQFVDPAVQELREQVNRLTGQLTNMTQGQQQAQHNSLVNLTAEFASEAGTDGKPLRPYFGELHMLPFIQQVKAENPNASPRDVLSTAYDRACWATPAVREKMLAAQEATRLAEHREKAARAQAAGSSVVGTAPAPGSTRPNNAGNGSVRDTLRAAWNAASV
jgi:hypothetical protein